MLPLEGRAQEDPSCVLGWARPVTGPALALNWASPPVRPSMRGRQFDLTRQTPHRRPWWGDRRCRAESSPARMERTGPAPGGRLDKGVEFAHGKDLGECSRCHKIGSQGMASRREGTKGRF